MVVEVYVDEMVHTEKLKVREEESTKRCLIKKC